MHFSLAFLNIDEKSKIVYLIVSPDLEHYDGHEQVQEETLLISFAEHQNELTEKVEANNVVDEAADKSSKEMSTDVSKGNEVVSQLAMEWDEEEESPSKSGL